ncbi:hypothetical protein SAMN05192568_1004177 [Methylobacterium pseudosasicola]|uniref:Uncharacterized protein n=1 Tax=Methylobacterium pseudosasicola TaxID=582667 RepID=A0A1I4HD81_9HYPH|nr:hypothetical protein SAMN05192568_1004177 [Methylobacterium pseudosasicola]
MLEAFGESRQAARRTFASTGIGFSAIGADRFAAAGAWFGEDRSLTRALHPYRHRNRCA